jgi:hypothetical protein
VRTHLAHVLGHDGPAAVDAAGSLADLGLTFVAALNVRRRLQAVSGLQLPAAFVFDHPSAAALAAYLHEQLYPANAPEPHDS